VDELTRRHFLAGGLAAGAALLAGSADAAAPEEIVDIHQHTHYAGRADETLLTHQKTLGITRTVLLPAGSKLGLDADCHGNDSVLALAKHHPKQLVFFANEVPDLPEAKEVIERFLKAGAVGIGEQKFPVECDSPAIHLVAQIARHFKVPVLLHFQHNRYNTGFLRFHKMLEKYPDVNFIGHAQTWWGNIDKDHVQETLYPKGPVTAGGYTDRLLSDYPNIYGDLSAGSGLNALLRDEEHARAFLLRHRRKLMYGSDCDDHIGEGGKCSGAQCLATIRRMVMDKGALKEILAGNAKRVIPMNRRR
jgi:predicted TIM-barrel fold metal-dependent hydrolase